MVFWGIAWGAVLGWLWPGHGYDNDWQVIAGAVLGALAGVTLRQVVRTEVARQHRAVQPAPAAAPAPAPAVRQERAAEPPTATAAPLPAPVVATRTEPPAFEDTHPQAVPVREAPARPAPRTREEPDFVTALVSRAWNWLVGGNTVVRIGVLVLFIGLAFLAKYAIENAMLPPELRLAAIGLAGIALFVFGFRMRARPERATYALTLQGAGIAVLYLTLFAAFRVWHFLPAGAAFAALALVCLFSAVIALALDAQALAFIGFAGGFAAPVLVSTGQGNHVGLFGYYLLLGVAIVVIAWLRAWRALNLLGFFATFGVATLWGVLRYRPEQFASTEPFLVAFFVLYLLAALFYALRHGQSAKRAVDATLVFGNAIVTMALQAALVRDIPYATAFSSLALGAVYAALGWWLLARRTGEGTVQRWLAECFAALALGFVTLAVPLAVDNRWTSAAWAVEGAAVYWMARRQGRWLACAFGLLLQGLAALLYLDAGWRADAAGAWPIANPAFLGAAMLAGSALAIAWWSREPMRAAGEGWGARTFREVDAGLSPVLFWIGFAWWMVALGVEIGRTTTNAQGYPVANLGLGQRELLRAAGWVLSAFVLHRLALPGRARPWTIAATPAWFAVPVMLYAAFIGMAHQNHVFEGLGWIAWPVVLLVHAVMLRRLDAGRPSAWWPWVHAGGVWLLVLLAGNVLVFAIDRAELWRTAWASVVLLAAGSLVLLALVVACRRALQGAAARWPLDRFLAAYAVRAAAPLAAALAAGALVVAVLSSGEARPLPYVPLLNPTDLAVAIALLVCALWLQKLRAGVVPLPGVLRGVEVPAVLAGIGFVALNTVWLRVAHHFGGVAWNGPALFDSFLVQAGYSILWTLIAVVLMVAAHRRGQRLPWMLGAGLLALTVLKLFVIDLSNRGGSERIVSFIGVGVLMLVVGWFAPLPPAQRRAKEADALQGAAP
ncbi:DUF2339 domain-containing protein [Ramlibacter sp. USB13]|uniref:DUF2339 domain-containing protein n=1 Tax=Ramlibacter cellulosilyticus TaxID=2764187 RepID=A0A923MMY0_9BURK|nr:DUF2339 domain-containing protein [Ramlibacter cellulosilyticus]MBC5781606.1 DUF2339 domain-containing protein [Ramlibacter cellulosilyticus]